ncbi:MAG: hypothetical protein ACYC6L_11920 [Anaerolineae bacterium]
MGKPVKHNAGAITIGLILIIIGLLATLSQLFGGSVWTYLWPGLIILPGILMFVGMLMGGKPAGGLAIPATIVTILGIVLFYQNLFNLWWTWSFIWALVGPVATGLGIIIFSLYTDNPDARKGGLVVLVIGLVFLAIFGLAFGVNNSFLAGFIVPLFLIGLGVYIVIKRSRVGLPPRE